MTSKQEAKLNMYHAVAADCDANGTAIDSIAACRTAFNLFADKVGAIEVTGQLESQVITGITVDKKVYRTNVVDGALNVAEGVFAYAVSTGNNTLKEEVNFSRSYLLGLRDDELPFVARNIYDKANANLVALADYGITAAQLLALNNLINAYAQLVSAPRNATSQRKAYVAALKADFKAADTILKEQMDKLVYRLKATYPNFYATYKNNRKIINAPVSASGIEGLITDSNTGMPIFVTATLSFAGTDYTTTSDAGANYQLSTVVAGQYQLMITASGYEDLLVPNVLVQHGKLETLNLQLVPLAA